MPGTLSQLRHEGRGPAIVVGAGIIGAACAWRMAERGFEVVVLERESGPATGSTGRSVAGVRHQFSEAVNVKLSMASIEEYRAMPQADYRPHGYLFAVPHASWASQRQSAAMQRALGAPVQLLTPQEAAERVPMRVDELAGATWCGADGVVDPHGICLEYVARARALGARFLFGEAVQRLERRDGLWHAQASSGRFAAPLVVNAAGPWAGEVARAAAMIVPVAPARRIVFATAPLPAELRAHAPYPLTIDLATGVYFRSEGERLIFGCSNPADTGFEEGIDWPWLEEVYTRALTRFPWFERLAVDRRACWWGYYEMSPDGNAVLGRMPGAEGWINACGFSGHGVQQAGAIGRVIADEACGEAPFIDVDALRIERFARREAGSNAGERLVI